METADLPVPPELPMATRLAIESGVMTAVLQGILIDLSGSPWDRLRDLERQLTGGAELSPVQMTDLAVVLRLALRERDHAVKLAETCGNAIAERVAERTAELAPPA